MPRRSGVAIYAGMAQDREGAGLGVLRQLEDCRTAAETLDWQVAEEYVDDDISAYSARPAGAARMHLGLAPRNDLVS